MKLDSFRQQLRSEVQKICDSEAWNFDNNKQRGMAFENWAFNLLSEMYVDADNREQDCIVRTDDFQADIVFPSKEFQEVFYIQCKFDKPAASDPIDYSEVSKLFTIADYLFGDKQMNTTGFSDQIVQLFNEAENWKRENYRIHFIFMSTGTTHDKVEEIASAHNEAYSDNNIDFAIWDIGRIRDEYVASNSIEESYPDEVKFTLGRGKYLSVDGPEAHLTFVLPGTKLNETFLKNKHSLFNWNIRSFLGKQGQVNKGMLQTIQDEPNIFYYLNNGISALCESFEFDEETRELVIQKLQVVNGAQTMGALGRMRATDLVDLQVLVKLTAVKHAARERGIAAKIIRANNTQNALRVPDFRSNDPIQLWLEEQFRNLKPNKGNLGKIIYGRKRPYGKVKPNETLMKMMDFGKIRFAWLHDPRIPISAPNRLFVHAEQNGFYEKAFGDKEKLVSLWDGDTFKESLLAVHSFFYCSDALEKEESTTFKYEQGDETLELPYKQLSRLKFYALKCMKLYADEHLHTLPDTSRDDLLAFGKKFDNFCQQSFKRISPAVKKAYRERIKNKDGAAFTLPRDGRMWKEIEENFKENCEMFEDMLI